MQKRLIFLSFELQTESNFANKVLQQLKSLKNLERIHLTVKVIDGLIILMNQSLNRESRIKHVDICFDVNNSIKMSECNQTLASVKDFEIKLSRYMKHLNRSHFETSAKKYLRRFSLI